MTCVHIGSPDDRIAEATRLSAERRAAFAARIGGLITWEYDLASSTLTFEEGLPQMFGLTDHPSDVGAYMGQIHKDDQGFVRELIEAAKQRAGRYQADFRVRRGERWCWIRAAAERVMIGDAARIVGFSVDIEEERQREDQLALVAGELQHRGKNILAIVQALAFQSFGKTDLEAYKGFSDRLSALAASNNLLTQQGASTTDLSTLVEEVVLKIAPDRHRIMVTGGTATIPSSAAMSAALALHELLTNALKYGALSTPNGMVGISWATSGDYVDFTWIERGGPKVSQPSRRGFGTRLLARIFEYADVVFDPEGVTCRFRITRG